MAIEDGSYKGNFRQEMEDYIRTETASLLKDLKAARKLFGLLDRVCDIIRLYVRTSWDECIFSAWVSDKELVKAETAMTSMEELAHIRNVLKLASSSMVYSSDGTLDWGEDAGQDAD